MPEIIEGAEYRRLFGDKAIIKVIAVSKDGWVKLRDADGYHFVRTGTFPKFFEKVDDEKSLKRDGE
jgi:hypothetical protein